MKTEILIIVFVLCSATTALAADTLYVNSIKAVVYKLPSSTSDQLVVTKKGTALVNLGKKGYWYNVAYQGQTGWVYKFLVRERPVIQKESLYGRLKGIFGSIQSIADKSRRRPSSYTSTAAARGLREKRKHFAGAYVYDYAAVSQLESIDISDTQAMAYMEQGISGEEQR